MARERFVCWSVSHKYCFPGYELNEHTKTCHKLHNTRHDWKTAKTICEAEGGYLVVINDEEEAKISEKLIESRGPALVGFSINEKNIIVYTVQSKSF